MVHASVDVHGIVNNTGSMSLATSWQHSKRRHSLPLVGLWVVAPNVVVKELVVRSSKTIVLLATQVEQEKGKTSEVVSHVS